MGKRCIAAGCGNTCTDKVSLFSFPKNPVLRQEWTKQVKRTRDKWAGPTDYSVLCSAHFTPDSFDTTPSLMESFGLSHRRPRVLKSDAIPTVFNRPGPKSHHQSAVGTLSRKP